MKTKLIFFWEMIKTSFWFIPALIVSTAIALAFFLIHVDSKYSMEPFGLFDYIITEDVDSARAILSTIAGAMLNVTSIVFSITLVALTLASSEYGSRLLRNFMNDRLNQTVLGAYIATFMFCLLIMRVVREGDGSTDEFIPNISIIATLIIALANIFLLIAYIHHIAVIIQADNIISDVSDKLNKSLNHIFPTSIGKENLEQDETFINKYIQKIPYKDFVYAEESGYLQLINGNDLIKFAKKNDLILVVKFRPGDLIVKGSELVQVHANKILEEGQADGIRESFVISHARTPTQDAQFAIHQLVEVIARALSPGINDPFTAITALDKLISNLSELADKKFPSPYRFDEGDRLRLVVKCLDFSGMADAAFNQVRQYGKENPSVLIRLMEGLSIVNKFIKMKDREEVILKHAHMAMRAGEDSFSEPEDLKDLRERYNRVLNQPPHDPSEGD
ncbi:DUF2254 domain-containing protein [Litoribacter alkaliphilus]|uniref:DUF2254 domain-containing protein n=1 Tax=Litoribacter ruber TaxID=702568 RepID=A0AAP2CGD9_9BACT|nr:DUF2254 domain-containing protein [Litoribacter alkaliphilus]MBS9524158.1 DUF2254 domain-containing protein [Litoribacter alkaliphilus]